MLFKDRREYNEYAPVPFWSWNNRLDEAEIKKQIRQMYDAKYGGFVIHARAGLDTPYLGEKWFSCVETAIITAKELNMKVWLYDEFGFPSGLAGGVNLQNEDLRAQYLEYREKSVFDKDAFAVFVEENGDFKRVDRDVGKTRYYGVYLKTSESEVNVCNPEIAENLIKTTYEEYYGRFKEYFGDTVEGFFTDEPQYYRYATPYVKELEKEFDGDIKDGIVWLFRYGTKGNAFRVRYYSALNRLYTYNYYKTIYKWCEEHNCKLTGHTIEEPHLFTQMWGCAGAMPSYEFCQVPGIDHLCKHVDGEIDVKQVESVAAQCGKSTVMTETFACSGFEIDPRRLKYVADHQYVGGVNYMVQHLMNYSIQGQGITDNPPDFSPHTMWWDDISDFNEYFAKLGYILRNSEEKANTLVVHPIHSAYMSYIREYDENSIKALDAEFTALTDHLLYKGVKFHYGDEWIIERKATVDGNKFRIGKCSYDIVILPYTENITQTTYDLLAKFVKNGGKLCFYKGFPEFISGERRRLPVITPTCDLRAAIDARPIQIKYIKGDKVLSRYCTGKTGEYLFLVNADEENAAEITFDGITAFVEYDIMTEKTYEINSSITIKPCRSLLLKKSSAENMRSEYAENDITDKFSFKSRTENILMLDFVRFSKDGVNFSERVFYSRMLDGLIAGNYAGDLYVRYYFDTEIDGDFKLMTGNNRVKSINFDGKNIRLEKSDYDIMYRETLLKNVEKGGHYIEFVVDYYNSPAVRHAFFDEGVTESLRNCAVYDTTVEPIFIKGDFSVFKEGVISAVAPIGGLDDLQNKGLKFFAGKVRYSGEISLPTADCKLQIFGDYMTARVYVNGKLAGKSVLDEETDISKFAKTGKNEIEIEITSHLKNMYGPHHVRNVGEIYGISPRWFTFRGCWKGDKAVLFDIYAFAPDYEFAPFGLNKIRLKQIL